MPYAQISSFAVDKVMATVIEEGGIAAAYIAEYHRRQGRRVLGVTKNLGDYAQQRLYDLQDSVGTKWEVKVDRLAHVTGNVYVEQQALEASEADLYLTFAAGKGYVTRKSALREVIGRGAALTPGGDDMRSLGLILSLENLEEMSEEVVVL